jgi:hypothetical protein
LHYSGSWGAHTRAIIDKILCDSAMDYRHALSRLNSIPTRRRHNDEGWSYSIDDVVQPDTHVVTAQPINDAHDVWIACIDRVVQVRHMYFRYGIADDGGRESHGELADIILREAQWSDDVSELDDSDSNEDFFVQL